MKTTITILLTAICVSGLLLSAAAQPAGPPDNNATAMPDQLAAPAGRPGHGQWRTGRRAAANDGRAAGSGHNQ